MVRQLFGKMVIYAVWHDKSIRSGWCMSVEKLWPDNPRPWPFISDDESRMTFAVFGPVIPYDEGIAEELGWMGMERHNGFEQCWEWLMSMDHNRYEDMERT